MLSGMSLAKTAISTHTLTWSVTLYWLAITGRFWFQLTRSRGAWRKKSYSVDFYQNISTHTLTWSVTFRRLSSPKLQQISTHTLTWSVTGISFSVRRQIPISTHTLTWSVTDSVSGSGDITNNFNSHAHVERDAHKRLHLDDTEISTHTLTWSVTAPPYRDNWQVAISTHTLTWSVT